MPKKKFYLTLDTETATLPFVNGLCKDEREKKKIAIAKPLVYDLGWVITDRLGNIIKSENFLIQETFFVPNIFNTAYYKEKRQLYLEKLEKGLIKAVNWNIAIVKLIEDLQVCDLTTAYNACFDFKKAIPFTEQYITHLYSADYNEWEKAQYLSCKFILSGEGNGENDEFLKPTFKLRGEEYPIADLWGVACDRLINIDKYRNYCLENSLLTASAQYFKTSAETSFQYLMKQHDFTEAHTALDDAIIEAEILTRALKKGKIEPIIKAFPFRELGTTYDYVTEKKPKYKDTVCEALQKYIDTNHGAEKAEDGAQYWKKTLKILENLLTNASESGTI